LKIAVKEYNYLLWLSKREKW